MGKARIVGVVALATLAAAAGLSWWARGSAAAPSLIFVQVTTDKGGDKTEGPGRAGAPAPALLSKGTGEPRDKPRHSYLVAAASPDKRRLTVLTPQFVAVSDPEVSYDGEQVLFAGKRAHEERWQIWEVRRDGKHLRQVTRERGDCAKPHYLPDERIVFCRTQGGMSALYTCAADGSNVVRITFNLDPIGDTAILPDGRILFAMRGKWFTVNSDGTGVAPFAGNPGRAEATRAQLGDAPVPAAPRPRPMGYTSVVDEKKRTGMLFCLNAYLSDRPSLNPLPAGSIKRVRIWAASPKPGVLGEAPVERDGSFHVEVPADTPLRLETLAAGDKVLGTLPTWIWVRPNEERGCIGCHEDRELSPENRVPMAMKKPPIRLVNESMSQ